MIQLKEYYFRIMIQFECVNNKVIACVRSSLGFFHNKKG